MSGLRRYVFALGPLAAAALWGGTFVVSKWSFALVPPVTLEFFRVALGAAALWVGLRFVGDGTAPAREDWPALLGLGGWVTLTIVTQFLGTELMNASQGSLLTVLTPIFVVVLGAWLLDERVTRAGAAGVTLAVVRRYSALTAATYSTIAATPVLGLLSAVELWYLGRGLGSIPLDWPPLFAIASLGFASTAAAWFLWYKGLESVSAGTVAVFYFLQPVVGTALAAVLLGEAVGPAFVVGSLPIGVGVWLVSRDRAGSSSGNRPSPNGSDP